ncbi:PREDICTED: conserved oligomeric Golgi complex subunit 3 [Dipodomys ordii]|uniref:Conserved oligomeric Golgi complex subunit 3 n=1 Tax=Dipodomys ordii TaxID=10020 RepID=A0A1S3ER61_DIPOR|nr:PREDICTED: conserved oligomeric Golgi complex subunit 3 [Dipodomys ordii]
MALASGGSVRTRPALPAAWDGVGRLARSLASGILLRVSFLSAARSVCQQGLGSRGAGRPHARLPMDDLCSLTSQLLSTEPAAVVPESTEDILLKGFTSLEMGDERIETAQQFFSWFAKLQTQMDQDEGTKYRNKLNSPTLSVNSEGFIPMLAKLDDCIMYISSHPNFKDYPVYLLKFKQCLSKALHLMKTYTVNTLQTLTNQLLKRVSVVYVCLLQVRSGCAFMVHVCQDEHQLYNEFFTKPTSKLDELLEKLCVSLYDVFRPLIIHVIHLETLSELCGILKNEVLEDHVQNNAEQLGAFAAGVKQMLEDVQERLVYRTHIYIQTDIMGYKPAPGDLAYPDKLVMMEQIAQSLKDEQKKVPSEASFSDIRLEEAESNSLTKSASTESLNPRPQTTISPADLHGMWYPTVRRTLVCLSKLYRCIDRAVFQGLSQEALSACIQSLLGASDSISKNKTQIDGQLFLIKHLLILREQIAPFHTEFTIKEISLDLKKTRDAAFKILNPMTVPRFFRLNSNNALIEFLLEGTPEIREHYLDSKKDVDRHLKSACEQFIQQQTKLFVEHLEEFMTKVSALKTMASQGGPKYTLSQQPWAQPAKVGELGTTAYKTLKTKLPLILKSMSLYLSNKETEFILFKPVKNNIQQVFQKFHTLLKEEFSPEDIEVIACPSMEQVNFLLSVSN